MQSALWNGGHLTVAAFACVLTILLERRTAPHVFWLCVALMAAGLAFAGFMMSDPMAKFEDFRRAYWEAGVAVWKGADGLAGIYARGTDGFVNLPIVAFLFAPFGLLDDRTASGAFTLLGVAAVVGAWRILSIHFSLTRREAALFAITLAVFGPLLYSLREGNLSHSLLLAIAGSLLFLSSGRHLAAGLLLGFIVVLKPSLALIGVYFVLRGQWRVVMGGTLMCVGALLLSLLVFGWDLNIYWYQQAVAPFAAGPVPGFNAQSIPALIARSETGLPGLTDWSAHILSPAGRIAVMISCGLVALGAVGVCLGRNLRLPSQPVIEMEMLIVIGISCAVSSLSWSHYYVWLLPAFVLLWREAKDAERWLLLAAFCLCAPLEFLSPQISSGQFGPLTNLLTSHLLLGGLLLLILLLRVRWRAGSEGLAQVSRLQTG